MQTESTVQELASLVGSIVHVTCSSIDCVSHGFHTSISVRGKLEQKPGAASYRVMADRESYCYFTADDVTAILPFSEGERIFVRMTGPTD